MNLIIYSEEQFEIGRRYVQFNKFSFLMNR